MKKLLLLTLLTAVVTSGAYASSESVSTIPEDPVMMFCCELIKSGMKAEVGTVRGLCWEQEEGVPRDFYVINQCGLVGTAICDAPQMRNAGIRAIQAYSGVDRVGVILRALGVGLVVSDESDTE